MTSSLLLYLFRFLRCLSSSLRLHWRVNHHCSTCRRTSVHCQPLSGFQPVSLSKCTCFLHSAAHSTSGILTYSLNRRSRVFLLSRIACRVDTCIRQLFTRQRGCASVHSVTHRLYASSIRLPRPAFLSSLHQTSEPATQTRRYTIAL